MQITQWAHIGQVHSYNPLPEHTVGDVHSIRLTSLQTFPVGTNRSTSIFGTMKST